MEPLLLFALSPATARFVADTAAVAMPLFAAGDRAAAVDAWLTGAFGPGFRETLDRALPGAFEQAVRDSGAAFGVEVPSLQEWTRGPDDLCRLAAVVRLAEPRPCTALVHHGERRSPITAPSEWPTQCKRSDFWWRRM